MKITIEIQNYKINYFWNDFYGKDFKVRKFFKSGSFKTKGIHILGKSSLH